MQITMKNIANYLHYGPGAVIFLNGFGPDLQNMVTANIGPCLLLEASYLDLSSLNNFQVSTILLRLSVQDVGLQPRIMA